MVEEKDIFIDDVSWFVENIGTHYDQVIIKLIKDACEQKCRFSWSIEGTPLLGAAHVRYNGELIYCKATKYTWIYDDGSDKEIHITIYDGRPYRKSFPEEKAFVDIKYSIYRDEIYLGEISTTGTTSYHKTLYHLWQIHQELIRKPECYTYLLFQNLNPELMCLVNKIIMEDDDCECKAED